MADSTAPGTASGSTGPGPAPVGPGAALAGVAIDRTSTVDQVATALRAAILEGRLAPGASLREHELAARMGVSRGTVREALRLMSSEGLVEHRAHRGAEVARLDEAEVADVYRARWILETAAVEAFAADDGAVAVAGAAVAAMRKAARADDVVTFVDAHAAFHATIVAALGSRRLSRFFGSLERELRLSLAVVERLTGSMRSSADGHARLLDVLTGGDPVAARRALAEHLRHGEEDLADAPQLVADR